MSTAAPPPSAPSAGAPRPRHGDYDVLVAGGGPAGATTALALARAGVPHAPKFGAEFAFGHEAESRSTLTVARARSGGEWQTGVRKREQVGGETRGLGTAH